MLPVVQAHYGVFEAAYTVADISGVAQGTWTKTEREDLLHCYETTAKALQQLKTDRKSTRLNSSHLVISYAVFCLKKKNFIDQRLVQDARVFLVEARDHGTGITVRSERPI